MISSLSKSEFHQKLEKFTKSGNPEIKGTPFLYLTIFTKTLKRFYGEFNNSSFRLTGNSVFMGSSYILEGKYKSINKIETKISYKIKPILFSYLMIRILPIIILSVVNFVILPQDSNGGSGIYIIVNIICLVFFVIPFVVVNFQKKQLINDFHRIFEIRDDNN